MQTENIVSSLYLLKEVSKLIIYMFTIKIKHLCSRIEN